MREIFIHGGGFVFGSVDTHDSAVRNFARSTDPYLTIVSLEYRLAPEFPYPVPFDDCYRASVYILKHANSLNIDPHKIIIMGDSAGGALAAAIMNKLIDKNVQPRPMTQILIYPTLQGLNFRTPSYREFNGNPYRGFVTSDMMVYFWITYALGKCDNNSLYLQNAHISDNLKNSKYFSYMDEQHLPEKYLLNKDLEPKQFRPELADKVNKILVDPYFSPLFAEDDVLRRMPQTYIMTCDFDPLRDEGYYYANRLRQLDVPVTHKHYEGYDHGILVVEFYSGAKVAQKDVMGFISNIV